MNKFYKVKSDKNFFNRFKELEIKLNYLSRLFQNSKTIVIEKQLWEYSDRILDFREAFDLLIEEIGERIVLIEERSKENE